MKNNFFSRFDFKCFFEELKKQMLFFVIAFFIGVILGFVFAFSNENYLKLLNSENKILFSMINSSANIFQIFWKKLLLLIVPFILFFLIELFYPISFLSFIFLIYQSVIFTEINVAIIANYGFSGVINAVLLIIPANFIYFFILIVFASLCLKRSKKAFFNRKLFSFFDEENFFVPLFLCLILIFVLDFVFYLIVPLFLKNFIIFIY